MTEDSDELFPQDDTPAKKPPRFTWKLLVVDDEPDVRAVTKMSLRNFSFSERTLEFIEAGSMAEALQKLDEHDDIAIALIDVVMETDDAGLKLVQAIREHYNNHLIRLIIRTGQPGAAPERYVIDHYDIDDYKDKTELTTTRLYTTVRSALKAYRDLCAIDINRRGLEHLLQAAPEIYRLADMSLQQFFSGVLTQVVGLCHLSPASYISTVDGIIATAECSQKALHAATEKFVNSPRFEEIHSQCCAAILEGREPDLVRENAFVVPIIPQQKPEGYIYIEPTLPLSDTDKQLIRMTADQCASALDNLRLHIDLRETYARSSKMLAKIAALHAQSQNTAPDSAETRALLTIFDDEAFKESLKPALYSSRT